MQFYELHVFLLKVNLIVNSLWQRLVHVTFKTNSFIMFLLSMIICIYVIFLRIFFLSLLILAYHDSWKGLYFFPNIKVSSMVGAWVYALVKQSLYKVNSHRKYAALLKIWIHKYYIFFFSVKISRHVNTKTVHLNQGTC